MTFDKPIPLKCTLLLLYTTIGNAAFYDVLFQVPELLERLFLLTLIGTAYVVWPAVISPCSLRSSTLLLV